MSLARIGIVIVALVAAFASAYALFRAVDERSAPPIVIEDAAASWPVVVEARGAVEMPGVHELPPGARTQDLVAASGGLLPEADLSTVNLARRLRDGEVVVFLELPLPGSTPAALAPDRAETGSEDAPGAKININTATAIELDVLPGIGEVTAARIIAYREENGPYRSVDDLIHVQGISDRTIDDFRHLVTTSP